MTFVLYGFDLQSLYSVNVSEPVGEFKTRVVLDRQVCDKEKIATSMANHLQFAGKDGFLVEVELS